MAVYNFAGQLLKGHPTTPKSVIDYIVFERSLVAHDTKWRICGKLPPQLHYNKNKA